MPIPKAIARLNRVGLNRLTSRIAPRAPGFGLVEHRGRRSGRAFRTPVNVFPVPDGFVIALTYGADSDWVRNVEAAGGCTLITRGRTHELVAPRVVHDPQRRHMPPFVRAVLARLHVEDFLMLDESPAG